MSKNKIILFSNVKGGVGKTTLSSLFASYLSENGLPVVAVDADLQQSLYRHRMREVKADPEAKAPWQITPLDSKSVEGVKKVMDRLKKIEGNVIIDCPGNLNDENLVPIFKAADVVVVPMSYDPDTVDATGIFIKVIKNYSPQARLVFLPNRINDKEGKAAERKQRAQTISILGILGKVTERVKQSVAIKRYSTLYPMENNQRKAVGDTFAEVLKEINE